MNATNPAYKRAFSTNQDNSAEYYWLRHVKPNIVAGLGGRLETTEQGKVKLPAVLKFRGQQLGRVMSRAKQMAQRVAEIEKYVKARSRELRSNTPANNIGLEFGHIPMQLGMQLRQVRLCYGPSIRFGLAALLAAPSRFRCVAVGAIKTKYRTRSDHRQDTNFHIVVPSAEWKVASTPLNGAKSHEVPGIASRDEEAFSEVDPKI